MSDDPKPIEGASPLRQANSMDVMEFSYAAADFIDDTGVNQFRVLVLEVPGLQMRFYFTEANAHKVGNALAAPFPPPPSKLALPPNPGIIIPGRGG